MERKDREIRDVISRLKEARVVDPAVGSGGFLLGMMQEMVALIKKLEAVIDEDTPGENLKLEILKNLYGFDIEPEAIEIAMLRLWLSLVIDREHPRPLPNINRNLVVIKDSLQRGEKQQQKWKGDYISTDPRLAEHNALHWLYLNEHDGAKKRGYLEQLQRLNDEFYKETGVDRDIIEFYMHGQADIVVMNPPYVRQESIQETKKSYYVSTYGLDKKSDLYGYFVLRAQNLLAPGGVASVITSDKWLETGYGVSLQKALRPYLVAIYGQKERSFGADINTVIAVYSQNRLMDSVTFTYIERYGESNVRRSTKLERRKLEPGKWFYLRAPKVFMEKILPKLTNRLGDFAEIRFGIKTGANDFFYLKDITHLYEADYLANPSKFKGWGLTVKTRKQLQEKELVYIENEGGERFVIEKAGISPLIRSIKDYEKPLIPNIFETLCFNVRTVNGLPFCKKYVEWGQRVEIQVTRGSKPKIEKGYHQLQSTRVRPIWYVLPSLKPAKIALAELFSSRFLSFYSEEPALVDHLFDVLYPKKDDRERLYWLYLNSTVFWIILELWSPRMGGGGGALHPRTIEYKTIPTPDLEKLVPYLKVINFGDRTTLPYNKEIKQLDKIALDKAILLGLEFKKDEVEKLLRKIYSDYIEVVNDRLIKASSSIAQKTVQLQKELLNNEEEQA